MGAGVKLFGWNTELMENQKWGRRPGDRLSLIDRGSPNGSGFENQDSGEPETTTPNSKLKAACDRSLISNLRRLKNQYIPLGNKRIFLLQLKPVKTQLMNH